MYSKKLKKVREEKHLLQKDLAKILSISEVSYGNYETEYFIMPTKYLDIISCYFNISINYLFEFTIIKNQISLPINKETSGIRLKALRKEQHLTQEKLANILNTTKTTICEYEKGKNIIATPFLYTICKKYKISADYLLGKVDNPKYLA